MYTKKIGLSSMSSPEKGDNATHGQEKHRLVQRDPEMTLALLPSLDPMTLVNEDIETSPVHMSSRM